MFPAPLSFARIAYRLAKEIALKRARETIG